MIKAKVTSSSAWVSHRYTADEVDWIAVFDVTTDQCFYLPSYVWDGMVMVNLRLSPAANGQVKGVTSRSITRYRAAHQILGLCLEQAPSHLYH